MAFNLTALLDGLGMPQYFDRLIHNGFDSWEDVLDITEADMYSLQLLSYVERSDHVLAGLRWTSSSATVEYVD